MILVPISDVEVDSGLNLILIF